MLKKFFLYFSALSSFSSFSQSGANNMSWKEVVKIFTDQYHIKLYYNATLTELLVLDFKADPDHLVQSLNAALAPSKLSTIVYNDRQWVVVKQEEASSSLASWQIKESLLANQKINKLKVINIGDALSIANSKTVRLYGVVKEQSSGDPAIGATITTKDPTIGTATDIKGNYELQLPLGENQLTIKALGKTTELIDIMIYNEGKYNVVLEDDAINLAEVVINERANDENIKKVLMGVEQLSLKEIKKMPSFMGELDIVKSLLSLPGVSTAGEGVGGLNIRGGNTDQNLILQDDIIYFNPSHALGFFSLFQPDLVESVKLYKGNIPAKYGGRLSSVLQTTSIVGDKKDWTIKGGLGLTSSKVSVQGPIVKDKLTVAMGGRLSTINWLLKLVQVPEVQKSKVNFYDAQAKLNYWVNSQTSIGAQFYTGDDASRLGDDVSFSYKTTAVSSFLKTLIGKNKYLNARVVNGSYSSGLDDLLPANASLFKTGVNYLSAKTDLVIETSPNQSVNFGLEAIKYNVNPGSILPANNKSEVIPDILKREQALEFGVFAEALIPLNHSITASAGLRVSGYGMIGEQTIRNYSTDNYYETTTLENTKDYNKGTLINPSFGIEPRISVSINLDPSSSFKVSANRTYQYLSQISNTVAATPIDFWKLTDNNIKPQSAHTVSLGYYKNFNNNTWETSVEVYYRDIKNAADYRDFADLLANEHIETELLIGKGKNYGAEFSIKKSVGKLTTRMGYTYSRSLRNMTFDKPGLSINQGEWYSSNYDKPHDLTLLLNLNPTQRYSFNFNFNYSTGRPISAPDGKYDDWNIIGTAIYTSRNNYRLPSYQRLDISMNIFPGYKKDKRMKGSWTLGVYNVLSRNNAYSVFFRQQSVGKLRAYKLSVLGSVFPSVTYNFEIK